MSSILIPVSDDYETRRKVSLLENIFYWCKKRAITADIVKFSDLDVGNLSKKYDFCYIPLTLSSGSQYLDKVGDIPIVIDRATPVTNASTQNIFHGKDLAVRSAFGQDVSLWTPKLVVPMLPQPYPLDLDTHDNKDVIIFDVKKFHSSCTHLYIASLIANVCYALPKLEKELGYTVKIYFTSFFDSNLYLSLFELLNDFPGINHRALDLDLISYLKSRIILPLVDHGDYLMLMRRCRLLLTEHGDIADSDVVHSLCLGVPTLTYSRDSFSTSSGFQSSVLKALLCIDKRAKSMIQFAEMFRISEAMGVSFALRVGSVPRLNFAMYEHIYLSSWDKLLLWATDGVIDDNLNKAMKGGWNRGVTIDKSLQARLMSSIGIFENFSP